MLPLVWQQWIAPPLMRIYLTIFVRSTILSCIFAFYMVNHVVPDMPALIAMEDLGVPPERDERLHDPLTAERMTLHYSDPGLNNSMKLLA
jgi:hypothetical protein